MRDRFDEINVFLSATETHNRKNVNRSVEESLTALEGVLPRAREEGLRCEGVISVAFGCPYEGHVDPARVFAIARRLAEAGAQEIGFGDTTGMANPRQVGEFFTAARESLPGVELTAHFHNTRGQGLANVYAAVEAGIDSFESSFGELGGCPVPAGATGNVATEDLISMLHEIGVSTGVDLPALIACSRSAPEAPRSRARQPHAGGRTRRLAAVMFASVLVANRGEIARRVIRTLDRLGVGSIAVYTPADRSAPHVREASAALPISSYLEIDDLLAACARTQAEALHPGYGFLSENPALARACARAGVAFIGPPPAAGELMGDKLRAKEAAQAAGLPIVPTFTEAAGRRPGCPLPPPGQGRGRWRRAGNASGRACGGPRGGACVGAP